MPTATDEKIHVAIVEDNIPLGNGLRRVIESTADFRCVGVWTTAEDALKKIDAFRPQVVLMDINLPDIDGVECVRRLKSIYPHPQVLMLTVYEDIDAVFSALRAGATGYLLKQTPFEELLAALRDMHRGGSPMSSHIARKVVQSFQEETPANPEVESLSAREREVLDLVAQGYLFKEIAEKLGVSFGTVHTYSRRIYEKLHVRSRAQAVAKLTRK